MTAAIAVSRLAGMPITFAAFGLHFRATGNADVIEKWVCDLSPRQVANLHIVLTKYGTQIGGGFVPVSSDQLRILVRCTKMCLSNGASLEAIQ